MTRHARRGRLPRRRFLGVLGNGVAGASVVTLAANVVSEARSTGDSTDLGIPGPFPGRVVEVCHPGMIRASVKDAQAIRAAVRRGMAALTGADSAVEAWRRLFQPGDVVGIKINPVGNPLGNTSTEILLETISGLRQAGIRPTDIVVFDRYREMLVEAGFHNHLPDGVRWDGLTHKYDPTQLDIRGYDPDEYISMELVDPSHDPRDDRTRRSHLGSLITRHLDKIVNLPVLKDHGSAGVTLALKNMSHGFVNNVARSHGGPHHNVCNQFIPQVVSHPIIRRKTVLHILDGIKGIFQGGPYGRHPEWTWERNSLLFATDPVAMDSIGWQIVDAQRRSVGLPAVGAAGKLALDADRESFDIRQPQHIPLAGALGLGTFDKQKIRHARVALFDGNA